jgi:hypothetical protein
MAALAGVIGGKFKCIDIFTKKEGFRGEVNNMT